MSHMASDNESFRALIPDPTGSKCSAFSKALLQLPSRIYEWMVANTKTDGTLRGGADIGDIIMSAAPLAETAYRKFCNGQQLAQASYPALYALLGTLYGSASAGNFKLPDYQARFPVGVGTFAAAGSVALGGTGGEDQHLLLVNEIPKHDHGMPPDANAMRTTLAPGSGSNNDDAISGGGYIGLATFAPVGGDDPHENRPPYIGCYFYIRVL